MCHVLNAFPFVQNVAREDERLFRSIKKEQSGSLYQQEQTADENGKNYKCQINVTSTNIIQEINNRQHRNKGQTPYFCSMNLRFVVLPQ